MKRSIANAVKPGGPAGELVLARCPGLKRNSAARGNTVDATCPFFLPESEAL
jgi:hypothetical protein